MEVEVYLALAMVDIGEFDAALTVLERVHAEAGSLGADVNEVWALVARGSVLLRRDPASAAHVIDDALARSRRIGYAAGIVASLRARSIVDLIDGDVCAAAGRLLELFDELTAHGTLPILHLELDLAAVVVERAGGTTWEDLAATARSLPVEHSMVGARGDLFPLPAGNGTVLRRRDAIVLARRELAAVRDRRDVVPSGTSGAAATDAALLVRGEMCEVRFGGRTAVVKTSKGLVDLARLVSTPGSDIHCLELMGTELDESSTGEMIDDTARRQYEQRIRELQADIDEAEAGNDYTRADAARIEMDTLVDHLTSALGLRGRSRRAPSSAERARSAVTQRVRATIRRLGEHDPALARHLQASIVTGIYCRYEPERPVVWST